MSNESRERVQSVLDCRGLACPQPVILTKRAIELRPESLTVIVDNAAAKENVAKFASASGYGVRIEEVDGIYRLCLHVKPNFVKAGSLASIQESPTAPDRPVFLITQNTLGNGNAELGAILMKAFFVSLQEASPMPRAVMLLNSGVYLAAEGSPVLPALQEMSGRGVNVMVCGTCLDYFSLKEKLAVGSVTNMYSILNELSGAERAITL